MERVRGPARRSAGRKRIDEGDQRVTVGRRSKRRSVLCERSNRSLCGSAAVRSLVTELIAELIAERIAERIVERIVELIVERVIGALILAHAIAA